MDAFTDLAQWLAPARVALLVIDMQADYVATNGHLARGGRDVSAIAAIVPRIDQLARAARAAKVPVIYTRQTALADGRSDSPARRRYKQVAKPGLGSAYPLIGTTGHAVIDALKPHPGDIVIDKFRSSAFHQTGLDLILRSSNREAVLLCGAVTEGCVESTARDAANHDYLPIVVTDAVASNDARLHEAALVAMRGRFDTATSDQIVLMWQGRAKAGRRSRSA